jgi:4-hydroxythreonine-4-phosphate dehydrogenase
MKKKIIIISGDPNSINSEIIYKCFKKLNNSIKKRIYLISNYNLLNKQFKKLKYSIKTLKVKNLNDKISHANLKIINLNLKFNNCFNIKNKNCSKFVKKSISLAHKLALRDDVSGIINCAINKNLLNKAKTGVTELLALKCKIKDKSEVMLITNKRLSVCPLTTHIDVKNISKNITSKTIHAKIKTIHLWYKKKFKKNPKIAMLGLNPHNAEFRQGSEEKRVIIPTIKKLRNKKINLKGPFVADTFFINDYKDYDVVVGMYHDQVLAPFKSLFKFDAINISLGLKYLRVSPDHGVAINIIGKNKADETSLFKCINFVNRFGK